MVREISAGGVVLRKRGGIWWIAVIELPAAPIASAPESAPEPAKTKPGRSKSKPVLALPKGLVDPGEKPLEAALREVREETGITACFVTKLADIKYVYVRTWGDGARVFKIVSFFMLRYESGRINDISAEMRIEVARARWVPLEDAASLLAYRGEKQMARKACEFLAAHPDF
ncbi:MAG TPA: NUDIX domain-containing protein [Candidatus Sulfotelmatobacter sp.]|jgi:8-oxo-dGTP pyrophosphatase MutT (NUDIX family)